MNKRIGILIMSLIGTLFGCSSGVDTESLKSFGQDEFSKELWLSSDTEQRSKMIYSFVNINTPIHNLSRGQVIDQLGESTSYYQYDEFPAYELTQNSSKFTLAFVIDRDTAKVKNIEIEKMP